MKKVALKRRAQTLDADNEIAVKKVMIQEEMTEARRVFREIKILQNMNHPNVLKIINIVSVRAPKPLTDSNGYDWRSLGF